MDKPDLSIIQVEDPLNRWCSSGHTAPETFKLAGADGAEEPTRFFRIVGNGVNGIYCEPCLCIANHIGAIKRKELKGK
jgi:hypothetical protein